MRNLSCSSTNNLYVGIKIADLPYQQRTPSTARFFPVPSSSLQVSFHKFQAPGVGGATDEVFQPIAALFFLISPRRFLLV